MRKIIVPRHKALANSFVRYLKQTHSIEATWERDRIDVSFESNSLRVLGELKIAYGGNTRHAIREALGQILEYNHYGKHGKKQHFAQWLLVLDHEPSQKDIAYINVLREQRKLPIFVSWPIDTADSFDFSPAWPH